MQNRHLEASVIEAFPDANIPVRGTRTSASEHTTSKS